MPFELSSLQSWNHSCAALKSIAEELSKNALRVRHYRFSESEACPRLKTILAQSGF